VTLTNAEGPLRDGVARAMLGRMNAPVVFAAPDPMAVSVHSGLAPADVIERLEMAVRERAYSNPGRDSPGIIRLGGSVTAEHVILTARPYVTPGLIAGYGAMTIELRGEVVPRDGGSEIRGTVSAPVTWTTPAFLGFGLIAWVLFLIAGNGSTLPTWTFIVAGGLSVTAAWAWIIRHNQRMALRYVGELTRMLGSIVSDPGSPR
jgi:hypothetical protein